VFPEQENQEMHHILVNFKKPFCFLFICFHNQHWQCLQWNDIQIPAYGTIYWIWTLAI